MTPRFLHRRRRAAAAAGLAASAALLGSGAACQSTRFTVQDAFVQQGGQSVLSARVEVRRLGDDHGWPNVPVTFFVGEQRVGESRTEPDGDARLICTLPDGATQFRAEARIKRDTRSGYGVVFQWSVGRTVILCDIDNTLSRTNYNALFANGLDDEDSPPIPGAAETLRELAQRFELVYLTSRPAMVREKTQRWLRQYDFPPGPLFMAARRRDALRGVRYKIDEIRALQQAVPGVLIGIGNSELDSDAYGACGLLTLIFDDDQDQRLPPHAIMLRDWATVCAFFDANRELLESPERLRAALDGEAMIRRPVMRFRSED